MAGQTIEHLPALASQTAIARAEDFMPLMSVQQAVERKSMVNQFIGQVLRESTEGQADGDYGKIPGAGDKKVLLKPGAEKLASIFGLAPMYEEVLVIEDWTGADHGGEPLFYYKYRCKLFRGDKFLGEALASANSWESKHRYRWLREDQLPSNVAKEDLPSRGGRQTLFAYEFALDKSETSGQYGKPAEYWQMFKDAVQAGTARRTNKPFKNGREGWGYEIDVDSKLYRIPNPDAPDLVNSLQKMASKRALVAAVLVVTNCSDAFTQDLEDIDPDHPTMPKPVDHQDQQGAGAQQTQQQAPAPSQRPIPTQLINAFELMKSNPKSGMKAIDDLKTAMVTKAGDVGAEAHAAILLSYRSKIAKGKDTIGSVKELLLDMFDAYEKLPAIPSVADVLPE